MVTCLKTQTSITPSITILKVDAGGLLSMLFGVLLPGAEPSGVVVEVHRSHSVSNNIWLKTLMFVEYWC